MSLQELDLTLDLDTLPTEVSEWIAEANRRREQFYEAGLGLRYPKYIPSNPVMVHAAIANLMADGQLRGDLFCEWGCGFGIAAGVASLLGLKAYGLEIETELAELATQLAADMKVPIEILQSNYLPEGFEEIEEMGGKELIAPESMMSRCIAPGIRRTGPGRSRPVFRLPLARPGRAHDGSVFQGGNRRSRFVTLPRRRRG